MGLYNNYWKRYSYNFLSKLYDFKNTPLTTSKFGKWKTASQHIAVIFCLISFPENYVGQSFYPFYEFSNGLQLYYKETLNLVFGLNAIYAAFTGIHYVWKNGF